MGAAEVGRGIRKAQHIIAYQRKLQLAGMKARYELDETVFMLENV